MGFEAVTHQQGNDHVVVLTDTSTNTTAEIFAFGAVLNSFIIIHHQQPLNVIDGFVSVADARANMKPMFNGAKLSPFVCRINNQAYRFAEGEYQLSKFSLGKHAIHGLIFDADFSIIETGANENGASVKLQHIYDDDTQGYPFRYRCEVEYQLKRDNELVVKTMITNIDEQLLPVADGWHPYFQLGDLVDDCQLEFQSKEQVEFDEGLIPTGKLTPYEEFGSLKKLGSTSFDNCFTVNFAECQPMCVFRNPHKKIQVEIYPSKEYPYLQIFTPGHRKSIALENLSAAPDAFNNAMGLKVLEPNEQVNFVTKFVIRSL
jgi:aldose 1-epimerase